jgi:dipeptidyl aminopeptidase/acylaminoacyl peptidase
VTVALGATEGGAASRPNSRIVFHGFQTVREIAASGGHARTLDEETGGNGAHTPRVVDVAVPDSGRRIAAVVQKFVDVGGSLALVSKVLTFRGDGSHRNVRIGPFGDESIRTVAISADSRFIAFDRNGDLYIARTGRGPMHRILQNHIQAPAFSPSGERIAFEQNNAGNQDIWVVNRNGSGLRRLTSSPADETDPVFSPDGHLIAFSSDMAGGEVRIMRADGSAVRSIVRTGADEFAHPDFSPGGGSFVFSGKRNHRFRFFTIRINGSNRRIVSRGVGGRGPQWARRP